MKTVIITERMTCDCRATGEEQTFSAPVFRRAEVVEAASLADAVEEYLSHGARSNIIRLEAVVEATLP